MINLDMFDKLCGLWTSHFNIMLGCVTLLAVVFGLVVPIWATFQQRKDLKDERKRLEKDAKKKFTKLKKQRKCILKQKKQIRSLKVLLGNAYISLAQFYLNEAGRELIRWPAAASDKDKCGIIAAELKYIGSTLKCVVNSQNRDETIHVLKIFGDKPPRILLDDPNLKNAVNDLFQEFPRNTFFVSRAILAKITGADCPAYQKFIAEFKSVLDLAEEFYHA